MAVMIYTVREADLRNRTNMLGEGVAALYAYSVALSSKFIGI
jgi:hypothetical protein